MKIEDHKNPMTLEMSVREEPKSKKILCTFRQVGAGKPPWVTESAVVKSKIEETWVSGRGEIEKLLNDFNTETPLKDLRIKLDGETRRVGFKLAEMIFKHRIHNKLLNILESVDVLSILEFSGLSIPWEMLLLAPKHVKDIKASRFICNLVYVTRIISNFDVDTIPNDLLWGWNQLNINKHLSITHKDIRDEDKYNFPEDFGLLNFRLFETNNEIQDATVDKELICIVAHGCDDTGGAIMALKDVPYSKEHVKFIPFPFGCFILLFSCRSHATGLASALAYHSENVVLGASTNIVTKETLRLVQRLGKRFVGCNMMPLVDFFKNWDEEDRLLRRLLAMHGSWKVILHNDS